MGADFDDGPKRPAGSGETPLRGESLAVVHSPLPGRFGPTQTSDEARGLPDGEIVTVAGRIRSVRKFGKLVFISLFDRKGKIQVSIAGDDFGSRFETALDQARTGSFVGVSGPMYTSRTGERTVRVNEFTLLAQSNLPVPQKYTPRGIEEAELPRFLEMLLNPDVAKRFEARSQLISQLRRSLEDLGCVEAETPVLQDGDSGAVARPFVTHHNRLDREVFLRVSPETFLKQLVVAGMERVFEIGKVFRNEGRSKQHLQEFTVLECYLAYHDHWDALEVSRGLLQESIKRVNGSLTLTYQGHEINFAERWPILDIRDLVTRATGVNVREDMDPQSLSRRMQSSCGLEVDAAMSCDRIVESAFRRLVLDTIVDPVVIGGYPAGLSPLTRLNAQDPRVLDKLRVCFAGSEVVHICAEENQVEIQRSRLQGQHRTRAVSGEAIEQGRSDFLQALEYGMPPLAGIGLGIDRLVAILTDSPAVRDVVLFPL